MTARTRLVRKAVDDVLGGAEAWRDADSTMASCPKCNNDKAYFYQLQIRSADEPMTTLARELNGARIDAPQMCLWIFVCQGEKDLGFWSFCIPACACCRNATVRCLDRQ
ncbi:hypothetical protein GGX14DRAFT_385686 [Mycena pura]|uniref:TFIIS-type domain-containing protein n=1 Tax=Mycena pura TaxID=153505 RepID=A0AAD6YR55_9AGAR|nr:hypothetical protein GGX14DRAFT_385686 [Mycena pura]